MQTPHALVKSPLALQTMIRGIKTHLGHGYTRSTVPFSVKGLDGGITHYLLQFFDTVNKKGHEQTTSGLLWGICNGYECLESFMVRDEVHKMDDGELRLIMCPAMAETMMTMPKRLVSYVFTTNDLFAMDSFTFNRPPNAPRCIENYVMACGKTRFAQSRVATMAPEKLVELYLTSRFMNADTIADILDDLSNDERFQKRAPQDLSDEERKQWNAEALRSVRERLATEVSPERFKELVGAWLARNLELSPTLNPVTYKEDVGRKVPMTPEMALAWDKISPLLFLLATSHFYNRSPVDLQLALPAAFNGTWIAEITPKDQRWGVSPPDQKNLDWVCKTPEGLIWLLKTAKTHGKAQEEFVAKLKSVIDAQDVIDEDARIEEALLLLTDGLNGYKHGILGLVKSIHLRMLTGEINLKPPSSSMVNGAVKKPTILGGIEELCKQNNINWAFESTKIELVVPSDKTDYFQVLQSIGAKDGEL